MKENLEPAFSEVLDILNNIEPEYRQKIPKDIIEIFQEECDKTYLSELKKSTINIKEKEYSEDALTIIAYLNLKYWCNNDDEKRKYRDMYFNNI